MTNILSIITFLPIVAALILAVFLRGDDESSRRNAKWLALIATSATFVISLYVLFGLRPNVPHQSLNQIACSCALSIL